VLNFSLFFPAEQHRRLTLQVSLTTLLFNVKLSLFFSRPLITPKSYSAGVSHHGSLGVNFPCSSPAQLINTEISSCRCFPPQAWGPVVPRRDKGIPQLGWLSPRHFSVSNVSLFFGRPLITPDSHPAGVSHHEPGGLSFRDVMKVLHNLKGNIIGADVVEYNPQRDRDCESRPLSSKVSKHAWFLVSRRPIECTNAFYPSQSIFFLLLPA
jgi:hypothetical protein